MVSEEELKNMSPEEIAELQKQNCIFCKIIKGEIPSKKVFEDDQLIAILDINPAVKGHTLFMPKEHYPILPIIPPELSAHMFRTTKYLSKAIKDGMVAPNTTVFIANGGIAGQQSPHFLYHIIPREDGDGLDNFSIPANEFKKEEIIKHLAALKGKIGMMMKQHKAKVKRPAKKSIDEKQEIKPTAEAETKEQPAQQQKSAQVQTPQPMPAAQAAPAQPVNQKQLASFIDNNPELKQEIMNEPEKFMQRLEQTPELKRLFSGINVKKLSAALKSIEQKKEGEQ